MYKKQLLDAIYDILAQNEVTTDDRNHITEHIDHVDYETNEIVFINPINKREYVLTLQEI